MPPKILCHINSGIFNSREFKHYFHFREPPTPCKGAPGGIDRGPRRGLSPNIEKLLNRTDTHNNLVSKPGKVGIRTIYLTFLKCKQTNELVADTILLHSIIKVAQR